MPAACPGRTNLSSVHISMTMKTPMRSRKSGRRMRSMTPPLVALHEQITVCVTFCPFGANLLSRSRFRDPQPERSDHEPIRIGCFDLVNRGGARPSDPGVARPGAGQDGHEQDADRKSTR